MAEAVNYIYFVIYSTILALFILYLLFFSSLTLGFIVSKIVSAFLLPRDTFLRINTFHISLLSGKIIFKGLKFATKNTCLRAVEGTITFRYWRKITRQSVYVNGDYPSEVIRRRDGLDVSDHQQQQQQDDDPTLTGSKNSNTAAGVLDDMMKLPAVKDFVIPRFYRLFSASSLSIRKGCLMVSNPELPTILVVLFDKATGLYTTDAARIPELDYYRQITSMDLTNTKMSLVPNNDYNGEEELFVERPQKEDFVTYAFESFKSVFKDFKFNFINIDENTETSELPRRRGKDGQDEHEHAEEGKKRKETIFDYGKHPQLLSSPHVNLQYYCDVAGPVPAGPEHAVFKEYLAPQWGVDVNMTAASIIYGPWADRNRALIQKFFFPVDYETPPIHHPVVGEQRAYANFNATFNLSKNSTFRIPFRELSKDQTAAEDSSDDLPPLAQRKPAWVDLKIEENSSLIIISPLTIHKPTGSAMALNLILNRCSISTSVTNTSVITARCFKMFCDVDYPLVWNHLSEWRLTFNIEQPHIFLLSDHITLFKDLGSDWSAGEPVDITMFVPKRFLFDFTLTNYRLFCNVNEQNIINIPNNLEENAHYVFTGPSLKANLLLPYISFQSPKTEITFNVQATKMALKLILPLYNTIRQHLEDIEMEEMNESLDSSMGMPRDDSTHIAGSSQFIASDEFTLNGKYLYYQKVDPSYLDSVVLNITGKNATVKLFGFYIRYFLTLKNNFFGYTSHIINLEKYKDNMAREREREAAEASKERAPLEVVPDEEDITSNSLEIYVSLTLEDATLFFPLGLYSSKQRATVGLHEFLLEIRYLPTYLDLYADFSPLVLNIPAADGEASHELLERYIQINDFTFKMHFLYGPGPEQANYADFVNIHIGTVSGHVLISQITSLGIWMENFFFHLINKDNALSTTLVSRASPVYSVLKLNVNTISLCLYARDTISEVRLPQGLSMHVISLIDQLSHNKIAVEVPEISFKALVPCARAAASTSTPSLKEQIRANKHKKWAEVGELKLSTHLSIFMKEPNWRVDAEHQREFLERHDVENRLLSFIWSPGEDPADDDYLVPSATMRASAATRNRTPNISPVPAFVYSPSSSGKVHLTPSTKSSSFLHPASSSSLKWTVNSPIVGLSQHDFFNQMKQSKSNLDISGAISDDESGDDPDGLYRTPESSAASESDDTDTDDRMGLYMTTHSDILTMPSPIRMSTSVNNMRRATTQSNINAFPQPASSLEDTAPLSAPLNPLAPVDPAQDHRQAINPQIASLRHHLRTYFFNLSQARMDAFGSTSRSSSFVECTASNRKMRSSYAGNRQTDTNNPHGSIHALSSHEESSYARYLSALDHLPPIPKRYPGKKQSAPQKADANMHDEGAASGDTHHDEFGSNTAINTITIDSMKDIELFATPVIVDILEELVESFIAKDPSIDYMLDNFQLRTISERFKVRKYLHNKTRLALSVATFNLHWLQSLRISGGPPVPYTTELEVRALQAFIATCHRQLPRTPLMQSDEAAPSLPHEAFCGFEVSLSVQSVHSCVRAAATPGDTAASLPRDVLGTYHCHLDEATARTHRIIVSFGIGKIAITGKYRDRPQSDKIAASLNSNTSTLPNTAFTVNVGEISVFSTADAPSVLFRVVDTWITNISTLIAVIERYAELWRRQLQTLIGELLRCESRAALHATSERHQHAAFIPPDFCEIIGEEALIHRLGWRDISRMRDFMREAERPHVDDIVGDVTLASPHDSYRAFQELINEIYEIDEGGDLIHLFQSPLIKKVFITPAGLPTRFDVNLQLELAGIVAAVVQAGAPTTNQLSIGRVTCGAVATYVFEAAAEGAHLKGGVGAPRSALDINFFSSCENVSIKIGPDLLDFVANTVKEVRSTNVDVLRGEELILGSHEWKEAVKPSTTSPAHMSSTLAIPGQEDVHHAPISTGTGSVRGGYTHHRPQVSSSSTIDEIAEERQRKNRVIHAQPSQSNLTITVHGHFAFKEINARAITDNNGVLRMLLRDISFVFNEFGKSDAKKKQAGESRPNGDYIHMIHSCIFSLPDIQLQLVDKAATTASTAAPTSSASGANIKPIIQLNVKNLMLNEVLFKTGKKKTRQNASGKREDYIEFAFKYDILLTFAKADLPFKMSHRFLPKLKDFLKAWSPADGKKQPAPAKPSAPFTSFPPVRIKLDLHDIMISTDAISSLPVKYNISRISASLAQFQPHELEFDIQLHQHHIVFLSAKTAPPPTSGMASLSKDPFMLPRIKAFGVVQLADPANRLAKTSVSANLEIGFIQNVLSIEQLENILVLRTTLSKELDDLLDAYINFADNKKKAPAPAASSSPLAMLEGFNYNFSLILRGFEILMANNNASLLLSTGVIDVRLANAGAALANNTNEFNWKVGLRGLSLVLSDPTFTLASLGTGPRTSRIQNMRSQIWAAVITDIALQSFPFTTNSNPGPSSSSTGLITSSAVKTSPLEKAWIVISKTIVTLQPWAIDKATNLWLYYFHAYKATTSKLAKIPSRRQRVKRALNSMGDLSNNQTNNLSLHVRIVDTSLCIPLQDTRASTDKHTTCSALVVALGSFTLQGVAIRKPPPPTATKPTSSTPIKVIGDCKFSKFSFQFVDSYHPSKLHAIHVLPAVNRGVIDNGDCQVVTLFSTPLVQCQVQLKTSGLFLHLDTHLLHYIVAFQDLVLLGQERLKVIGDTAPSTSLNDPTKLSTSRKSQSQPVLGSTPATTPPSGRLEIEFTLRTTTGEARLTKHATNDSNLESPSLDGSFDAGMAKDEMDDTFQECFPLPPLAISMTHVLTPAERNTVGSLATSKSETNFMVFLDSQEIKLTPFFTHYMYDLVNNAPASTYAAQFTNKNEEVRVPEDSEAADKTTPGSVTLTVRISPTKVLLNGVDQILAIVEIGTLDIFLSSIIKDTTANKRVLLMNGTLSLNNFIFKIFHSASSDERLGILLRSLQANIGTAHGITDGGPVVSVLFNSDSAHCYFNAKYLDEIIILLSAWIPTSRTKKKIFITPPPSPVKAQRHTQNTLLLAEQKKKKPQVYITLKMESFGLDIDFLPITRSNMLIHNICAVYSPNEEDRKHGILFYTSVYTGPISILCHGKLEGNLELEGIAMVGERKPYKQKEINMWTAYLSPIRVSFDFNQSEILELRSGDITFRFYDPPAETGQPYRNINLEISCAMLQVQLSCETITSILEIIKRINESITDKLQNAKKYLNQHKSDFLDLNKKTSIIEPLDIDPSAPVNNVVVGQIKVKGKNLKILLFGYSIKDPTWINFTLESYQVALDQTRKKDEVHRQLSILLGQNHISKMTEESVQSQPNWARDPFTRRANETKIVKIPVASLIMYTTEHANHTIEFYYLTEFTDSIAISVNLGLYADIRDITSSISISSSPSQSSPHSPASNLLQAPSSPSAPCLDASGSPVPNALIPSGIFGLNGVPLVPELYELFSNFRRYKATLSGKREEELTKFQNHVNALFEKDYVISLINNKNGELCATYPPDLIVIEREKQRQCTSCSDKDQVNNPHTIQKLLSQSRFARVRTRFPFPVILYHGKNLCRSSTLSKKIEYMFQSGVNSMKKQFSNSTNGAQIEEAEDSQNMENLRNNDISAIKHIGVKYICDLMVENKKKKFGFFVCSSEKADMHSRYSKQFVIASTPYPGVEFFALFNQNRHNAKDLVFSWEVTEYPAELKIDKNSIPVNNNHNHSVESTKDEHPKMDRLPLKQFATPQPKVSPQHSKPNIPPINKSSFQSSAPPTPKKNSPTSIIKLPAFIYNYPKSTSFQSAPPTPISHSPLPSSMLSDRMSPNLSSSIPVDVPRANTKDNEELGGSWQLMGSLQDKMKSLSSFGSTPKFMHPNNSFSSNSEIEETEDSSSKTLPSDDEDDLADELDKNWDPSTADVFMFDQNTPDNIAHECHKRHKHPVATPKNKIENSCSSSIRSCSSSSGISGL
eukprot:gene3736-4309_t